MSLQPWLEPVWQRFSEQLAADRLAHALLIPGPEGIGKTNLALTIAARLLCTENAEFACGGCRSCKLFESGAHPDWNYIQPEEGKQIITVLQVRDLISRLALTTSFSSRKVVLFNPAEAMNMNAANALLKSLEEPPGDAVILLVTSDAGGLPVTIRSRCQVLAVAAPAAEDARAWLLQQGIAGQTADSALLAAGGSPLKALAFAQSGQEKIHATLLQRLGELPANPDSLGLILKLVAEVDPDEIWTWLSHGLVDLMRSLARGQTSPWFPEGLKSRVARILKLQQSADRNRYMCRSSVRQDLLLQEWLIEWARLRQA